MKQVKMPKWSVRLVAKSARLVRSCARGCYLRSGPRFKPTSASCLSGQFGFSLLELMIACVLGGMLIYSAAQMLGASAEYVTESQRKDVEGKLFSSYQAHFKKLTRKAQISALFFHQPVDLSQPCLDLNFQGGPCGFTLHHVTNQRILDKQKKYPGKNIKLSKVDRACMTGVDPSILQTDTINNQLIQFFSDRSGESELLMYKQDEYLEITHYPLLDTDEISNALANTTPRQEVYAGWKLTDDRPLTMITMARKENYYFTVPLPVRHLTFGNMGDITGTQIVLSGSPEVATLTIGDNDEEETLDLLEGSLGLFYASAETRVSSIFMIKTIEKCDNDDTNCKNIINQMISDSDYTFPKNCNPQPPYGTSLTCENAGNTTPTKGYYQIMLTPVNEQAIIQGITNFAEILPSQLKDFTDFLKSSAKFHLSGGGTTYSPLFQQPSLATSIHKVDALLQDVSGNENNILIFIPIKFVKLKLKTRDQQIMGSLDPSSDKQVVIKNVYKEVLNLNPTNPNQNNRTYPILTNITSAKKKTDKGFFYKEKDIIIARKLGSHSRKLSTIIGVLNDETDNLNQKACPP